MAARAPPVGELRVFTQEGSPTKDGWIELSPRSTRYKIVEDLADMGLCILETPEGRNVLISLATRMLNFLNAEGHPHFYTRPMADLPHEINHFLRVIRGRFPIVYLSFTQGEGMAVRQNWYNADYPERAYDPQLAVKMHLNRFVINNMIFASQQPPKVAGDNYDFFRFQMMVTMAHEITHSLMGYFTGTGRPNTPPTIALGNFGGESGRVLEGELFGGVVEFYLDRDDPLANRQAGIPYLMDDGYPNSRARMVSTSYIIDFVNGAFEFPIRVSTRAAPSTRSEVRTLHGKETSQLRTSRSRNAKDTTSPPRAPNPAAAGSSSGGNPGAGSGSASRDRRLPVQIAYRSGAGRPEARYREEREEYYLEEEEEELEVEEERPGRVSYGGRGSSSTYAGSSSSRVEERSSRGGGSSSYYASAPPSRPEERGYGGGGGGSSYGQQELVYRPARDARDSRRGYY
ncbi:hypothetical protein B0T19DRAFT_101141 [Cercophora scortea]|uniref:Uncharacterized protein n=1 Tax=Cercophora scortea TaxID=314031 RepID=A0AAE0MHY5_9PEZI|nr:hypothetical protein B0T19DRAFT_101141 [Cercophora scortea]